MDYWETSARTAAQVNELLTRACVIGVAAQICDEDAEEPAKTVTLTQSSSGSVAKTMKLCSK
jgi:hypothetical protein